MSENTLFSLDDTGVKEIQATYTPKANKTIIGKLRVAAFPNYKLVEITWENYSNLTEEEKNSETIYFITDKEIISFKGILYADDYNKIDNTPIYLDENNEVVINENYQAFFDLLINKDIEGNTNEIIVSDGEGWAKGQDIIIDKVEDEDGEIEYRIGIDNYKSDYIKKENSKITFTDDIFCKTWYKGSTEQNIYNFLTLEDSAKVHFSDKAQLLMHDAAKVHIDNNAELFIHGSPQVHMDNGSTANFDETYSFTYTLVLNEELDLTYNDIMNNENTIIYAEDEDRYSSLLTEEDMADFDYYYYYDSEITKGEYEGQFWYSFQRFYLQNNGTEDQGKPQVFIHGGCKFYMDVGEANGTTGFSTYIVRYTLSYENEQTSAPSLSDFSNLEPQVYNSRYSTSVAKTTFDKIIEEGYSIKKYYPPYYKTDKKVWYLDFVYGKKARNFNGKNPFHPTTYPEFFMHDKSYFAMQGGTSISLNDTATLCLDGNSNFKMDNNARAHFNAGIFLMQSRADNDEVLDTKEPCVCMQSGSQILFNGGDRGYDTLDPILEAGQDSFQFVGKGSNGCGSKDPSGITSSIYTTAEYAGSITVIDKECLSQPKTFTDLYTNAQEEFCNLVYQAIKPPYNINGIQTTENTIIEVEKVSNGYSFTMSNFKGTFSFPVFGGPEDLYPENNNPRIRIADETMLIIDAQPNGSNYIKIGADSEKQVQLHLTGNIFQQMSGNAHSEMHDDSKLIMRGNYTQAPWYDYVKDSDGNIIEESRRPVLQGDNGPIVGLYDNPVVMIRGTWEDISEVNGGLSPTSEDYVEDITYWNTVYSEWYNKTSEERILENFSTIGQDFFKNLINKKYSIPIEDIVTCKIYNMRKNSYGKCYIKFGLIVYKIYRPENWSPHLEEKENNPYIEIIESSKVKLSGHAKVELTENFSISTDENGFNFSDGTSSVSFTLAELQNLKALLSN